MQVRGHIRTLGLALFTFLAARTVLGGTHPQGDNGHSQGKDQGGTQDRTSGKIPGRLSAEEGQGQARGDQEHPRESDEDKQRTLPAVCARALGPHRGDSADDQNRRGDVAQARNPRKEQVGDREGEAERSEAHQEHAQIALLAFTSGDFFCRGQGRVQAASPALFAT